MVGDLKRSMCCPPRESRAHICGFGASVGSISRTCPCLVRVRTVTRDAGARMCQADRRREHLSVERSSACTSKNPKKSLAMGPCVLLLLLRYSNSFWTRTAANRGRSTASDPIEAASRTGGCRGSACHAHFRHIVNTMQYNLSESGDEGVHFGPRKFAGYKLRCLDSNDRGGSRRAEGYRDRRVGCCARLPNAAYDATSSTRLATEIVLIRIHEREEDGARGQRSARGSLASRSNPMNSGPVERTISFKPENACPYQTDDLLEPPCIDLSNVVS